MPLLWDQATTLMFGAQPLLFEIFSLSCRSGLEGLAVKPGLHIALPEPKAPADPVGRKAPGLPLTVDRALWYAQVVGHVINRHQPVAAATAQMRLLLSGVCGREPAG